MTRQRNNRSDWENFSAKRRAAELDGAGDVYGYDRKCSTCNVALAAVPDGGCLAASCPYRPAKPRAKPVQHEAAEMVHLFTLVTREWWAPGYQRWEHRSAHQRESEARWREGASPGWPDCGLFVPVRIRYGGVGGALKAVCEVKAENLRPKRFVDDKWWVEPFDGKSKHGLRQEQAYWLRLLSECGFATFVAYGAAEAFQWLSDQAGPRPTVLPEGWER